MRHAHLGRETRCENAEPCLKPCLLSDKLIRINAGVRRYGQMAAAPCRDRMLLPVIDGCARFCTAHGGCDPASRAPMPTTCREHDKRGDP